MTLVDANVTGNKKFTTKLTANVRVKQRLYFGNAEISKISGILDYETGGVIANAFETLLNNEEVEKNLLIIDSLEDAPVKPYFYAWVWLAI